MSDITVYGPSQSTYLRSVCMLLEEKGRSYEVAPVEFRSEAHRRLHPFLKVPAFRHGEVRLFETLAITSYVDAAFAGPRFLPDEPVARAVVLQWISAINDYLYPVAVVQIVIERLVAPLRGATPNEAVIAAAAPRLVEHLGIFDAALGRSACLAGAEPTLADIFLAPIVAYLPVVPEGRAAMDGRTNIVRWFAAMSSRPSFQAAHSENP